MLGTLMITAKNYSAHVERSLLNQINKFTGDEKEKIYTFTRAIANSVHFAIPDSGVIFDDNNKGLMGNKINLPFPEITIEWFDEYTKTKVVIFAAETSEGIMITVALKVEEMPEWVFNSIFGLISKDMVFSEKNEITLFDRFSKYTSYCESSGYPRLFQERNIMKCTEPFFEFIEAMSCTNVEPSTHESASPKNEKRIKQGKLPIYETKILTIKPRHQPESIGSGIKGTHSSPRQHLRRGHIRRLPSGNIWVNSCVVGNKENGIISKSYAVI